MTLPGSPIDPADLPPEPVGEVPPVLVAPPREARRYLSEQDVLGIAQRVVLSADATFDREVARSTARMKAGDRVVEAACAFVDGHPAIVLVPDDPEAREGKLGDLVHAVEDYWEVVGDEDL